MESMKLLDDSGVIRIGGEVTVFIVEDRSDVVRQRVSQTGEISVPYVGLVNASGKTSRQLAFDIRKRLQHGFFPDPTVLVSLNQVGGIPCNSVTIVCPIETVTLRGQVRKTGRFELDRDLTVSELLRLAGGHTTEKTPTIRIIRTTPQGTKTIVVHAKAVLERHQAEYDLFVRSYDVVMVE